MKYFNLENFMIKIINIMIPYWVNLVNFKENKSYQLIFLIKNFITKFIQPNYNFIINYLDSIIYC